MAGFELHILFHSICWMDLMPVCKCVCNLRSLKIGTKHVFETTPGIVI